MTHDRSAFDYGRRDGVALQGDAIGAVPGGQRPGLLWIHGGGLIFGSRSISPRPGLVQRLLARGFVVFSIDHRLAPETKLPDIVGDVEAAWAWLQAAGAAALGIDPRRLCVAGASAGGYLSLLLGARARPRPAAVASFWGFGDITAAWEAEPSAHYRAVAPLVSRDAALASLAKTPVPRADGEDRSLFYLHCRQQGLWLPEVTGHALPQDAAWFEPWCPLRQLDAAFPPTVLLHGRADADVPASESDALAARLQALGVPHAYRALDGIGHGFAGATPEQVAEHEAWVVDFLAAAAGDAVH